MPDLTFFEYQQIAALRHNSGYVLLLDSIKAQIDNIALILAESPGSDENEKRLLHEWRALRKVYVTLNTMPEEFAKEVNNIKIAEEAEKGPQMPNRAQPYQSPLSAAEIDALIQKYEKLTGKKVVLN